MIPLRGSMIDSLEHSACHLMERFGTAEARAAARRIAITWRQEQQRRIEAQIRADQARWMEDMGAEARARAADRARKIAEIQQIARGL